MEIINTNFSKRDSIKRNFTKWYNPLYKQHIIAAICMIPWNYFTSFLSTHVAHSYLRSTFEEVWEKEYEVLDQTSKSKFRNKDNVNQWLMRYWQLAAGRFIPRNINNSKIFMLKEENNNALRAIEQQKYKMICLNDTVAINDFETLKNQIITSFEAILPEKSKFEL